MTEIIQYDLFIVYADDDAEWVEEVLIPSAGLPFVRIFTKENFRPGIERVSQFNQAVTSSHYTLLVVSPAFLDDEWAMYTKSIADYSRVSHPGRLLPLLLKPCELPQEIELLERFDCTQQTRWQREFDRLRQLVNQIKKHVIEPSDDKTSPEIIQQYIWKNKIGPALDELKKYAINNAPDLLDEVILLGRDSMGYQEERQNNSISPNMYQNAIREISRNILTLSNKVASRREENLNTYSINQKLSFELPQSILSLSKENVIRGEKNLNRYSTKQRLPRELHKRIVEFLVSIPNIYDSDSQRALINSAGLDAQLQHQISFAGSSAQFFELLITTLSNYGTLEDGRNPIDAILHATKNYVGQDRRTYCDALIKELLVRQN